MYQYLYTTGSTDTGSLSLDFRNDVVFTFLLVTDHAALIDLLGIHLHQLIAAFFIKRCAFRAECPNIIFLFFFHHAIPPFTAYALSAFFCVSSSSTPNVSDIEKHPPQEIIIRLKKSLKEKRFDKDCKCQRIIEPYAHE